MKSDKPGKMPVVVGLLLTLMLTTGLTQNATVQFDPDTEYVYSYSAFSHLKHTALVKVTAEVSSVSLL